MRDRIVSTIATLTTMLEEQTLRAEETEDALLKAVDLSAQIQGELEVSRRDLEYAEIRARELHDDLARMSASRQDDYQVRGRAQLLCLAIGNPTAFAEAMGYMGGTAGLAEKGNKIVQIKNVRERTRWGLKEAKDFVECFYDFGTFYEPPVLTENAASAQPSAE